MTDPHTPLLEPVGKDDDHDDFGHFWDDRELRSAKLWRATMAELLGTFTLFTIGISVDILWHENVLVVAATWGLSLAALTFVYEEISGAHFNPATSFATFLVGKISMMRVIFFTIAQILGALFAGGIICATIPPLLRSDPFIKVGLTRVEQGSIGNAFLLEMVLTFFLIYVDFSITLNPVQPKVVKRVAAPFAIGAIFAANILYGFHLTGASMNPARSFTSAVYSHDWPNHWIYWLAPFMGAVAAAVIFKAFIYGNDNKTDEFMTKRKIKSAVTSSRDF